MSKAKRPKRMSVEAAEEMIAGMLPQFIERLTDLALGVLVQEVKTETLEDPETGAKIKVPVERVYREKPDRDALKYLTERVLGRVPQRMEITGEVEQRVKIIPWMPREEAVKRGLVVESSPKPELPAAGEETVEAEFREVEVNGE